MHTAVFTTMIALVPLHLLFVSFTLASTVPPVNTVAPNDTCNEYELVGRKDWGAKPPKDVVSMVLPVKYVFIHHTAMSSCTTRDACIKAVKDVQDLHMDGRGWSDAGYNFLVGEDGRAYQVRGWNRTGAHTKSYNDVAVAVSVMGDYTSRLPNQKALDTVQNLLACGVQKGFITPNYELFGHRDVRKTECPGEKFYQYIRTWKHYSTNYPTLHIKRGSATTAFASAKLLTVTLLANGLIILVNL
uniref:Peptidoglycan recognition protein 3 n=1 Tax=Euprymna scolopes TaxID=6613 RepID=Q32S44_EUPSC|nr:peptidoglycan recognition protein 3 precursor [Euprymna scolopes]